MHRLIRPALAAAIVAGGLATTSTADANVEIGGTAGVHVFSKTNELGVPDVANAPSERNSALFGLRLGLMFGDVVGIEGEFGAIPSEARSAVFDIWNLVYRGHLILQFGAGNPDRKFIPFILGGGGGMQVVYTKRADVIAKDTDAEAYAGIGFKYRVPHGWGLRVDGRILFPPSSTSSGPTVDYEGLLSIYKEFGRDEKSAPESKDRDGDGINDDVDKCPTEPEDKDGFQDDDGCPDPDNDADGVPDATDKCPTEAEDKDGFQDDDGCPEADNDNDGIPDAADKCPNEAEDKDGFQDDDGCPETDNDADGVPDANDKCPNDAETKNGFQDDDGCPDELPAKLKQFTGVIQGINFKVSSADLLPASNATLNKAVAVLKEFANLRLEIQGHTDDQPMKRGKFEDNTALSQARAESVKAYFVKQGIDESRLTAKGYGSTVPLIDPTGLKGAKLNAVRAKNRRVEFKLLSALTEGTPPQQPPAP